MTFEELKKQVFRRYCFAVAWRVVIWVLALLAVHYLVFTIILGKKYVLFPVLETLVGMIFLVSIFMTFCFVLVVMLIQILIISAYGLPKIRKKIAGMIWVAQSFEDLKRLNLSESLLVDYCILEEKTANFLKDALMKYDALLDPAREENDVDLQLFPEYNVAVLMDEVQSKLAKKGQDSESNYLGSVQLRKNAYWQRWKQALASDQYIYYWIRGKENPKVKSTPQDANQPVEKDNA